MNGQLKIDMQTPDSEQSSVALPRLPIADQIWNDKYRLKVDGKPVEPDVAATMARVAQALAKPEKDPSRWAGLFGEVLEDQAFLPAGRIIAGAGTDRRVSLFNCFVMGTIPDDMAGIFDNLKEAALTMQQGGGIGYDFSTLRPKGAPVRGVGADASGPLTFMDVWDSMCRTIMSAGSRRGAMMATLRCDHPDVEAFVDAKRDPARLRMFNLSVLVTDAFMEAVKDDAPWDLVFDGVVYRTVKARALWDKIMQATYAYAEPGVIFIDRINQRNNLHYCETIASTNPCGEQPLPPYGACLLGSVNLARLVVRPFSPGATLDAARLETVVARAVRMMDNVIDISGFALDEQRKEAVSKRRIGLGVTGLADALIMCGLVYGSSEACDAVEGWLAQIQTLAYRASVALAKEKGPFPLFDAEEYLASETVQSLPTEVQDDIRRYGIRNALLTSIAPTGTISLFADNVSSGLEPVFAFTYARKVLEPDGTKRTEDVSDYAYRLFRSMHGPNAPLPPAFVTAQTLVPEAHVAMQAAAQRYIDSSISKTVNLPADISFDDFKDVYRMAYELDCKGCTTYRPNEITGSVLSVDDAPAESPAAATPATATPHQAEGNVSYLTQPLDRAEEMPGSTYKIPGNPNNPHAMYVTINDLVDDQNRRRPFEIFINTKDASHHAWIVALTRMVSAVFRRGGDVGFVPEELQAVFDPSGGYWGKLPGAEKTRQIKSPVAHVGHVIEHHMRRTGFLPAEETDEPMFSAIGEPEEPAAALPAGLLCPKCNEPHLIRQGGCDVCQSCGHSKCG